jgi:hypothetical protein
MHLADYVYLREFELQYFEQLLKRINTDVESETKVMFIEVSALERSEIKIAFEHWLENSNNVSNLTVLIHNGDQIPDQKFYDLLVSSGLNVYSVNCADGYSGVKPLPIGLENRHLRRNGIGREFAIHEDNIFQLNSFQGTCSDVFSSFNLSTNFVERSKAKNEIQKSGYVFTEPNLSTRDYQRSVRQSRFVISPPGNGSDCHRTWEAIYLGAIPIVLKQYINSELLDLFPVIAVNKWQEFLELSGDEKCDLANHFDGLEYPAMSIDYWEVTLRNTNDC